MATAPKQQIEFDYSKYGFRDEENYTYKSEKGLNENVVRTLSKMTLPAPWRARVAWRGRPVPRQGRALTLKHGEAGGVPASPRKEHA